MGLHKTQIIFTTLKIVDAKFTKNIFLNGIFLLLRESMKEKDVYEGKKVFMKEKGFYEGKIAFLEHTHLKNAKLV